MLSMVCAVCCSMVSPTRFPLDGSSGNLVGDTIEQQTAQTIDNISAIREAPSASRIAEMLSMVCAVCCSMVSPTRFPLDPSSGNLVGDTIEQQTAQTIDNISAILEADVAKRSAVGFENSGNVVDGLRGLLLNGIADQISTGWIKRPRTGHEDKVSRPPSL